ncbi:hypothetical protein R69888_06949 [Paraburkholderia haematera]|uniref:Transposase n=1 Tax=Paraburkholderia haematera TaxID=2793077 RepID=A0ABN7N232_9BURK|nr:hypothetical protein R69888_06949 [Paraburkholderia haematera]
MMSALVGLAFEQRRQIRPLPAAGVKRKLPADLADDAACRLPLTEPVPQVPAGRVTRRCAFVPGAQRGKRVGIGKIVRHVGGDRVRETRFHDMEFSPEMSIQR